MSTGHPKLYAELAGWWQLISPTEDYADEAAFFGRLFRAENAGTVLELGCGLGLVSVTAALAGARVLAVDRSPEGIAFTAANAAHNGVTLQTAVCAFDQPEPLLAGAPWDLVLTADVLYEPRNVPVLLWLLPRLVDASGEVWLADPGRRMQATFLAGMDATGWQCERLPGEPDTVAILRLRRPESGVAPHLGRTGR